MDPIKYVKQAEERNRKTMLDGFDCVKAMGPDPPTIQEKLDAIAALKVLRDAINAEIARLEACLPPQ